MHWLLILTLTYDGRTAEVPWALVADASTCTITGGAVVLFMRDQVPGLQASFTCAPEVRA